MTTRFEKLVDKARQTNAERDSIDRQHGRAAPADCPLDIQIATACSALKAGMNHDDWDCVAEAFVMLEALLKTIRSKGYR